MIKRLVCSLCFITIILFSVSFANEVLNNEDISVGINHHVKILYNEKYLKFFDAQRREVYPITYLGSTYLPIRAISGLFNTTILWNGLENKIYLDSTLGLIDTDAVSIVGSDYSVDEITFDNGILNRKLQIERNGVILSFYDANGDAVYPISYNDTTYLPIRALANIFNRSIYYESKTNSVLLFDSKQELDKYLLVHSDINYLKYKGIDDSFFDDVEVVSPRKPYPSYLDEEYKFLNKKEYAIVIGKVDDCIIYIDISKNMPDLIYSYNLSNKEKVFLTKIEKSWYNDKNDDRIIREEAFGFSDTDFVLQYKVFGYKYIFVNSGSKIYIAIDGDIKHLYLFDITNRLTRELYRSLNQFDLLIKNDNIYIVDNGITAVSLKTSELVELDVPIFNNLLKFSSYFDDFDSSISGLYYCEEFLGKAELIFPESEIAKLSEYTNFELLKSGDNIGYYPMINEKYFKKVENDTAYIFRITLSKIEFDDSTDRTIYDETYVISNYYYFDRKTNEVILLNSINHCDSTMLSDYGRRYFENQFDKEISRLYYPDFFTKNEYNTLKSDYVNILGNKLNSKYYDYIYNVPFGDSTEIKYVSGDYSRDNPITSGEANFDIAVLNDSLSQFYLGYEEDPVTGKNIYEDKNRELEKELEHIDSDILKALKIQSLNLEDMYPSIDENDNDFYFALNGLLICNGNHISDYYNYSRAKEILVIINDEVEVKYTLNDSDEFQFIDFKYVQKDITKPINLKIKVLSTYSGYRSKNIYFSHIIPAVSSNIPQGR